MNPPIDTLDLESEFDNSESPDSHSPIILNSDVDLEPARMLSAIIELATKSLV